jgi:hypothetical protein
MAVVDLGIAAERVKVQRLRCQPVFVELAVPRRSPGACRRRGLLSPPRL